MLAERDIGSHRFLNKKTGLTYVASLIMKYILKIRDLVDRELNEHPVRLIILCVLVALAFTVWYANLIL